MTSDRPSRRYFTGLLIATSILLAGSLFISWLDKSGGFPPWVIVVAAIVPVAALLAMFWVHGRYLQRLDEYLRQLHVKALLAATAITLGVATAWGYLEMAANLPLLAVYWLNPLFWVTYALAVSQLSFKDAAQRP